MRIVFLSHTSYSSLYTVGSHRLAWAAIREGHEVLYISPPKLNMLDNIRQKKIPQNFLLFPLKNQERTKVKVFVPRAFIPLTIRQLLPIDFFFRQFNKSIIKEITDYNPDVIFLDHRKYWRIMPKVSAKFRIFRSTDLAKDKFELRSEKKISEMSLQVFATHEMNLFPSYWTSQKHIFGNGVELKEFSQISPMSDNRVGTVFIGALDNRFDWGAVSELSEVEGVGPIHIYGDGNVPGVLPPLVDYCGPLPNEYVPYVLSQYKTGALFAVKSDSNKSRSPMKMHEYLASGLDLLIPNHLILDPDLQTFLDQVMEKTIINEYFKYSRQSNSSEATLNYLETKNWDHILSIMLKTLQ